MDLLLTSTSAHPASTRSNSYVITSLLMALNYWLIVRLPKPADKKGLQEILGKLNFYHRFVPHAANILRPLHNALKGDYESFVWTDKLNDAFTFASRPIASSTLLVHPRHAATTRITVDASSAAIGASLEQYIDGHWQPLAFCSKNMKPAETRYSSFDRELMAMYLAVRHFRHFIEGRIFHIYTDHKPLTFAFSSNKDRYPRQTRHI